MGKVQEETNAGATTEIREYGDGKTIILYTEDDLIYQTLKDKAEKEIHYEVWKDADPAKKRKVAADLYFPRTSRSHVKRVFEQLQKAGKNGLKSKTCQKYLKAI